MTIQEFKNKASAGSVTSPKVIAMLMQSIYEMKAKDIFYRDDLKETWKDILSQRYNTGEIPISEIISDAAVQKNNGKAAIEEIEDIVACMAISAHFFVPKKYKGTCK